jgi:hypothetical protein
MAFKCNIDQNEVVDITHGGVESWKILIEMEFGI